MADIDVVKIDDAAVQSIEGTNLEKLIRESATFFKSFERVISDADNLEAFRKRPEILILKIRLR